MDPTSGTFVISLDFELYWGVRDCRGDEYFNSLRVVHQVVPSLLALFEKYDVSCTWATVGALMLKDFHQFEKMSPSAKPGYDDVMFSPYAHAEYLKSIDTELLFAPELVRRILLCPRQEIASHTFSHYYTLEPGQQITDFYQDLIASKDAAKLYGATVSSLVFPRNQFNDEYLKSSRDAGFKVYRGNPDHWAYRPESRQGFNLHKRLFRLLDSYIPLSGPLVQSVSYNKDAGLYNVPASLFFRPYNKKLAMFERLKLARIKWSMTSAAKRGGVFQLWWHPHNFSKDTEINLFALEEILKKYSELKELYSFESLTMACAAVKHQRDSGTKE